MRRATVATRFLLVCWLMSLLGVVAQPVHAVSFPVSCNNNSPCPGANAPCDDLTPSLGIFEVWISDGPNNSGNWRAALVNEQGWGACGANCWTSAVFKDPSTRIGRSVSLVDTAAPDSAAAGCAGTSVTEGPPQFPFTPPGFDTTPSVNQILTELRHMDLEGGLCPCGATQSPQNIHARAGSLAGVTPSSFGQVEAQSTSSDFPARSFFDVFVEVDLTNTALAIKIHNHPGDPLVVSNPSITTLPPSVVYVHGVSSAVPVYVKAGYPNAGELFGYLRLAGHMTNVFCSDPTTLSPPNPTLFDDVNCTNPSPTCASACSLIQSVNQAPLMPCPQCVDVACSPEGAPCNDGNACTTADVCQNGTCQGVPVSCDDGDPCTFDSCVHTGFPACVVPDNGSGSADLPPAGCEYHGDSYKLINGLPPGTTIDLDTVHKDFICNPASNAVCSFSQGPNCRQAGGTLGGEQECSDSTLVMNLSGTGVLSGWNRVINLPISFETHAAPRVLNAPVQTFATDMYRLFGQLTSDQDFDLLRITAGTNFGLPSPGQTTLKQLPSGQWEVNSCFDINYRIDYVGAPGGHIPGIAGSTTGVIHKCTGAGLGCVYEPVTCDDGNPCTDEYCSPQGGGICVVTPDDTNTCSDGDPCTAPDVCRNGECVCDNLGPCPSGTVATFTNTTSVPIPTGPAVVSSTITVGPGAQPFLSRLRLTTNILHTNNADLDVTLTSPSGTVVTIHSDDGGTSDNVFNGTLWDDKADPGNQVPFPSNNFPASNIVTDTTYTNLVVKPTLSPEEALGAFFGEDPNGVWTLRVSDDLAANGGTLSSWSLELTTYPAAPTMVTTTFANTTPVVITDSTLSVSTVTVAVAGTQIGRVRLRTNIRHTFIADMDITLTSPGGRIVTIVSDAGTSGSGNNDVYNGTLWDDKADPGNQVPFPADFFAASNLVTDTLTTNLVVKPTLAPEEPLAAFLGDDPNGVWTLRIFDDATGDAGTLDQWLLEITTTQCPAPCVVLCNDNNPCTDDACDPVLGCVFVPNDSHPCNDGSVCTLNDHCSSGVCLGTPISCDDGDVCTDDTCHPIDGCMSTPNNAPCEDGNACTTGDACEAPIIISWDWDDVVAPALPAGWTTAATPATDNPWTTTTAFSVSPPNSVTTDTPPSVSDKTLDGAPFFVASPAAVDFENRYNLESTFDGAVLEIKIGAGAFTDILTAGGSFVAGGYNATISTGFSSPIAGRAAWSGDSGGFIHTRVILPAAAVGQTVQLRHRVASDVSVTATPPNGQWIDDGVVRTVSTHCVSGPPSNCDDSNACTLDSCDMTIGCLYASRNCDDSDACTSDSCDPPTGCVNISGQPPAEVTNVQASKGGGGSITVTWNLNATETYDIVRGALAALPVGPGGGDEVCLADNLATNSVVDGAIPAVGAGFWYLPRGNNACGSGSYGNQALNGVPSVPRVTTTCP